jgi:hypothetical protein
MVQRLWCDRCLSTPIMLLHGLALVVFRLITVYVLAQDSPLASESGIYDSSETPVTLPWNTYNYCNAPHVNAEHYELPPDIASMGGGKLVHVSVVMRHHKVSVSVCVCTCSLAYPPKYSPLRKRPHISIYPLTLPLPAHARQPRACRARAQSTHRVALHRSRRSPAHVRPRWGSDRARRDDAAQPSVRAYHLERVVRRGAAHPRWAFRRGSARKGVCHFCASRWHPFSDDASSPKKDLWELYHDRLGFLVAVDPTEIRVRTSTEDRTLQVAGAMLAAMDPRVSGRPWKVHTQPASVRDAVNPPRLRPSRTTDQCCAATLLDRLDGPGVPMPRRGRGARRVPSRAGVDDALADERIAQGASRRSLCHCRAQRMGQVV